MLSCLPSTRVLPGPFVLVSQNCVKIVSRKPCFMGKSSQNNHRTRLTLNTKTGHIVRVYHESRRVRDPLELPPVPDPAPTSRFRGFETMVKPRNRDTSFNDASSTFRSLGSTDIALIGPRVASLRVVFSLRSVKMTDVREPLEREWRRSHGH